ncbi:MAG: EAL domain-containing protein [Leptospiraceae bacterium]|nr:EAL domain-containing protein [Leptospiraceae bacterium]
MMNDFGWPTDAIPAALLQALATATAPRHKADRICRLVENQLPATRVLLLYFSSVQQAWQVLAAPVFENCYADPAFNSQSFQLDQLSALFPGVSQIAPNAQNEGQTQAPAGVDLDPQVLDRLREALKVQDEHIFNNERPGRAWMIRLNHSDAAGGQPDADSSGLLIALPASDALTAADLDRVFADVCTASRVVLQQVQYEQRVRERSERYSWALLGALDGIWDWYFGPPERFIVSTRWKNILGLSPLDPIQSARNWLDRIHPADREAVDQSLQSHLQNTSLPFRVEYRVLLADESYQWVATQGVAIRDRQGQPVRMAGVMRDISSRKALEANLRYAAEHDELTGLYNRAYFIRHLKDAVEQVHNDSEFHFALLFFDLDRFKYVNDSLGHVFGDRLLQAIARELQELPGADRIIARLGGDEFGILLFALRDSLAALDQAQWIQAVFQKAFTIDSQQISTNASIGIALSSPEYTTAEDMLRDADAAMYQAKQQGKARYSLFDDHLQDMVSQNRFLEQSLTQALAEQSILLFYQPILNARTLQIERCEALLRFSNPELNKHIEQLIALSEHSGVIHELGFRVIEQVLKFAARLLSIQSDPPVCLSLNVSAVQLENPVFFTRLSRLLKQWPMKSGQICLELTENIMLDKDRDTVRLLQRLKELDFNLAIDDFGTGFSSLSCLQKFPIDTLKVDRSFLHGVHAEEGAGAIAASVITLGHILGLQVVAEGVETQAQADFVRSFECDFLQGFLYYRPMPADEFESLLRAQNQAT